MEENAVGETAGWPFEKLAQYGDDVALVYRDQPITYRALLARTNQWRGELAELGIKPGAVIVVDGGFSLGRVSLVLALTRAQAVIAPATPLVRTQRPKYESIAEAALTIEFDD